jgi:hypothetical protein
MNYLLSGGALAACGVAATVVVYVYRGIKLGAWHIEVGAIPVAFLAGLTFPYGLAMLAFPFADPPPNIDSVKPYLPLTGLLLIWAGYIGLRQAVRDGASSDEARNQKRPGAGGSTGGDG